MENSRKANCFVNQVNKEEWVCLLEGFYQDRHLPYSHKVESQDDFYFERKCLPGMNLNFIQSFSPFNLKWENQKQEAVFSMNFMLKGHLNYSIQELNSSFDAGQNNIIAIPAKTSTSLTFAANTFYSYRSCILKDEYLECLVNRYPEVLENLYTDYKSGRCSCLKSGNLLNTGEMLYVIQQIDNAFLKGKQDDMYMEAKIMELLALQIHSSFRSERSTTTLKISELEKIREAEHLLTTTLNRTPTIHQLSLMVGLNTKKLKLGFKAIFGTTIYAHLLEYKMNKAKHLLLEGELNIYEVGLECGYDNASHFSTAFKRKFNVTPMEFRKRK